MTPLAMRCAKELTLPVSKRTMLNMREGLRALDDIHCFEVSEIRQAAYDLSCNREAIAGSILTTFLPAPKTWIEYSMRNKNGKSHRTAFLVEQLSETSPPLIRMKTYGDNIGELGLDPEDPGRTRWGFFGDGPTVLLGIDLDKDWIQEDLIVAYCMFINSPRVIGRRQHMPHRGLERKLTRSLGAGKFPLHAWTEIKLEVCAPQWAGDGEHEAHLTGRKALHFCRSHLRVRNGRLEIVRAHWRGDPALGIKRSRYKLVNGRAA